MEVKLTGFLLVCQTIMYVTSHLAALPYIYIYED